MIAEYPWLDKEFQIIFEKEVLREMIFEVEGRYPEEEELEVKWERFKDNIFNYPVIYGLEKYDKKRRRANKRT